MLVLLIEDNPDHESMIEDVFHEAFAIDARIDCERCLGRGLERLAQGKYDVCLCDLNLPDSNTEETRARLPSVVTGAALVALTALTDAHVGQELVRGGIQDFLPKDELCAVLLRRVCLHAIERKKIQTLLEDRNRDQLTFCHSLSHDFKSYLRRIALLADLLDESLRERIELTDKEQEWLQALSDNTNGLSKLVSDLSDYFSLDAGGAGPEPVDLGALVVRVRDALADETRPFEMKVDSLPLVEGFEAPLYLLFQNLISNAVKYNEADPIITVRAATDAGKGQCTITIEDNGIGINADCLDRIFAPFQRLHGASKYQGVGLGLSIVKRVVDNHRGRIAVESEEGAGSRFHVTLPMPPKAA